MSVELLSFRNARRPCSMSRNRTPLPPHRCRDPRAGVGGAYHHGDRSVEDTQAPPPSDTPMENRPPGGAAFHLNASSLAPPYATPITTIFLLILPLCLFFFFVAFFFRAVSEQFRSSFCNLGFLDKKLS